VQNTGRNFKTNYRVNNKQMSFKLRPRPTALLPPRSYGKPEAAAAVDGLLMMGIGMPETC